MSGAQQHIGKVQVGRRQDSDPNPLKFEPERHPGKGLHVVQANIAGVDHRDAGNQSTERPRHRAEQIVNEQISQKRKRYEHYRRRKYLVSER